MVREIFFGSQGNVREMSGKSQGILFEIFGGNPELYMGERIAGKQDRPSLIIEDPLRDP